MSQNLSTRLDENSIQGENFDSEALFRLAGALRARGYSFTTPTPATHALVNARPENAFAQDLRGVFGWSREFSPSILPREIWDLLRESRALSETENGFRALVRLSSLGDCVFWHSAYPTTASDAVFFGPDTYRFASALQEFFARRTRPVRRAIDIGCGAGPGAILCARNFADAQVFGADINNTALQFTRLNARINNTKIEARHSNLLNAFEGNFDLIVANPPYLVDASQRAYRHGGGPLGAGLSLQILETALGRLEKGGVLVLYTGAAMCDGHDPFWEECQKRLRDFSGRWNYREMDPDIFGEELETPAYNACDRIAAVVLEVEN